MPIHSSSELIYLPFLHPQSVEYFHSQHAFTVTCLNNPVDSSSAFPCFLFMLLPQVSKLVFFIFSVFGVLSVLLDMLNTCYLVPFLF